MRLLNDPTECVAIDLDRLPNDAEDCAGVLQAELAPLESWIEIAEAYLARGDEGGFTTLMEMVCAPGAYARRERGDGDARGERARGATADRMKAGEGRGKRSRETGKTGSRSVRRRDVEGKGRWGEGGIGDLSELERLTTVDDDGVDDARRRD